ncbi:MAG: hypothetical protein JNL08_11285 [Planctomycetes bacterium]|nr:hypothetical protein [Planctomycetota bacterium]
MAKKAAKAAAAPVAAPEIEVVSKPGLGIDEGIVLTTFFLLIGAIVCVYLANQAYVA